MNKENLKICSNCIIPDNYKGFQIDERGKCKYCNEMSYTGIRRYVDEETRIRLSEELDQLLYQSRGKGKFYDVAIGYSGGKDSTYLAILLKNKYNLNVLGIVIDHSFFPDQVEKNINKVTRTIHLDTIRFSIQPEFMVKYFKYKFLHYKEVSPSIFDTVCGECSNIIEGMVMKIAAQFEIPYVLIGLSPEQTNRYFYQMPSDHVASSWIKGSFVDSVFSQNDRKYIWNPDSDLEKKLKVYFPFHVWDYNVNIITEKLSSQDVLSEIDAHPLNTECHMLQSMRYLDKLNLGYDPRIGPFSDLVRFGKANRDEYIQKFYHQSVNMEAVRNLEKRLGIEIDSFIE